MAFSWILGKRHDLMGDTARDGNLASNQSEPSDQDGDINLEDVRLDIEDGLLVATGPLGDPLTPEFLKQACASQLGKTLTLSNGKSVDQSNAIAVLEAQKRGPLAELPRNSWIEAMLEGEGCFEPVSTEDLAKEEQVDQPVSASELTIEISSGETITIRDVYPGTASLVSKAKLSVGSQSMSIESLLERLVQLDLDGSNVATSAPTLACQNDTITLSAGDQLEACLEEASDLWDGEAKLDLLHGNGQSVSIADLSGLLKERRDQDIGQTTDGPGMSYPLLDGLEPDVDLSDATIVMISNVPEDWSLTHGLQSEQGAWMLDPSELAKASVKLPGGCEEMASFQVQVISIVGHAGTLERQTRTVEIPPTSPKAEATSNLGDRDRASSDVQLAFNQEELDLAVGADAILLRGLPETASLSAGTYDSSVGGWVLRPTQLDQLAISDLDHHQLNIEIILKAIYFDQVKASQTKIIAKKLIDSEPMPSGAE